MKACFIILIISLIVVLCPGDMKSKNVRLSESEWEDFLLEQLEETGRQLEKEPDNVEVGLRYVNLLCSLGRYKDAEKTTLRILENAPRNLRALLHYAVILYSLDRFDELLGVIEQCEEIEPHHPVLYDLMAHYYNKIGDEEKEINTLLELLQLIKDKETTSDYGSPFISIRAKDGSEFYIPTQKQLEMKVLYKLDDFKKFLKLFYEADVTTSGTLHCDNIQRRNEILRILESLMRRYPQIVTIKIRYGEILSYHGRFDEAKKVLNEAIVESPTDMNSYILLSGILTYEGKYNESLDILDEGLKNDPECHVLYIAKGSIYEKQKHYNAAVKMYENALHFLTTTDMSDYVINYPFEANINSLEKKISELKNK